MRLAQQHGDEHGAGLRHLGDLNAFLEDYDRALRISSRPVVDAAVSTVSPAW